MEDLERVIRESIVEGQPRTHRPWRKIMILVEGIYSMEGEICKLPDIVKLKKKYKVYIYIQHSSEIYVQRIIVGVDFRAIDSSFSLLTY
jgi:serine palmitoyltransferase